jgi:hypothetical protein
MSTTPRTDAGFGLDIETIDEARNFARELELELNEANKELIAIREIVGVRGDCKAFASDAEHWLNLMAAWDENVKLRSQLVNAEKDTARLDWLERPQQITHYVNPFRDVVHRTNSGQTLREAIDAAMEAGK